MRAKQYDIPPLTMLRAFEAASRRGAFNEAASELNVTPGAVSHQVKALEKWLGMALFSRGHRAVTLTDEGERLFAVLRDSFRDIAAITSSLRMQAETPRVEVLATTDRGDALPLRVAGNLSEQVQAGCGDGRSR